MFIKIFFCKKKKVKNFLSMQVNIHLYSSNHERLIIIPNISNVIQMWRVSIAFFSLNIDLERPPRVNQIV